MMVDQSYEYNGPAGLIAQVDRNGNPVRHQEFMPPGGAGIIAQVDRNGNAVRHHDLPQNGVTAKQGISTDSVLLAVSRQPPPAGGSAFKQPAVQSLLASHISFKRIRKPIDPPRPSASGKRGLINHVCVPAVTVSPCCEKACALAVSRTDHDGPLDPLTPRPPARPPPLAPRPAHEPPPPPHAAAAAAGTKRAWSLSGLLCGCFASPIVEMDALPVLLPPRPLRASRLLASGNLPPPLPLLLLRHLSQPHHLYRAAEG
jgi:hypothetical protein